MEPNEPRIEPKELHIEWQNLRTEIYELDKACLTILQVTIAVSAGLIGWYSSAREPGLGMIIVLSPIWMLAYIYLYHKRLSIRRIEGYLRVVIESKDYTPKWEKKLQKFRADRPFSAKINTEWIELLALLGVQAVVAGFTCLRLEFPSKQTLTSWLASPSMFGLALPIIFSITTCLLFRFLVCFNNKLVDSIWENVEHSDIDAG